MQLKSPNGIYQIKLPLYIKEHTVMSGICIDNITGKLLMYPLQRQVENDLQDAFKSSGRFIKYLPSLPKYVGGPVDFMIGSKYLRYYPEKVFSLPVNADGRRGVIGSPHFIFTEIDRHMGKRCLVSYLSYQYQLERISNKP